MYLKFSFFTFLFLLLAPFSFSQNFVGKVTDAKGNPIYGSSIFIKETNQGLICNELGEYQTTLKAGNYMVEYRSMGYKSQNMSINIISGEITEKNLLLEDNPIALNNVVVTNKEDPAYEIMRHAIKQAPTHANIVKHYKAESYIKGVFELQKVAKLVDKVAKVEGEMKLSDFKEKLFLQESYNDIEFTAPNKYVQTVKAFSSSVPDDLKPRDAIKILNGSLYNEEFSGLISPLHPDAFSYYKFRYEGFIEEGNQIINKIKVTSKYHHPKLVNGYLYIADNTWDIRNAEIVAKLWGMENEFKLQYSNVAPEVYLPSSYTNTMKINFMGISGYYNYFASVKYNEIEVEIKENAEKIRKGKEIKKREFEIKADTTYTVKSDSMAQKRDSTYWAEVRNTPLTGKEIVSYEKKDSIQNKIDSIRTQKSIGKFRPSSVFFGGKIGGDSTKMEFKYGGIKGIYYDYNYVDGFLLGQQLDISRKIDSVRRITFAPEVFYATARKTMAYTGKLVFDYAPMRIGEIKLSGGKITSDFNPNGIDRFDNASASLLSGKNYSMLYEKTHFDLTNSIDIKNGLRLHTGIIAAKRKSMRNHTDYYFTIKDKTIYDYILGGTVPTREVVPNREFGEDSYLTEYFVNLTYFPYAYYKIVNGKKEYKEVTSPIFNLAYSQAVSLMNKNNSVFRRVQFSVQQNVRLGYFSSFSYNAQLGTFLGNRNRLHELDYKNFHTSDIWSGVKRPFFNFMLLDAYEPASDKYWFASHLNYTSQYNLLVKRLPFLQSTMMNESLHMKFLHSPNKKYYSELGYSIDFLRLINLGIFVSFDKFKHQETGIRLYMPINIF